MSLGYLELASAGDEKIQNRAKRRVLSFDGKAFEEILKDKIAFYELKSAYSHHVSIMGIPAYFDRRPDEFKTDFNVSLCVTDPQNLIEMTQFLYELGVKPKIVPGGISNISDMLKTYGMKHADFMRVLEEIQPFVGLVKPGPKASFANAEWTEGW